jgi:glycine/D-amino acid oxidase-like deaminating enzyme
VSPDFLILRGGIAGPLAEYFLAERGRVVLLERGLTPSVLLPDRLHS